MPADRSKQRSSTRGFKPSQFEAPPASDMHWTEPVQTIEFTTNVTPTTYTDDTPPPLYPPSSYIFPPEGVPLLTTDSASAATAKQRARKGSGYIPRPPNAFILFRSSFIKSQHVSSEVETNHSTLSKIIGMTWQNLPHDERQAWHVKAKEAQEDHKRRFPTYAFKPATGKGAAQKKKRKVRETEPKDLKRCEKIVELLCNGKKGDELNTAVKDFDKNHVPEFITRFEAPITARAFRRPSSAPLPDTEHEQSKQSFFPLPNSMLPQRRRSSSTEPDQPRSEIRLPSSGLVQFDPSYSLESPSSESFVYPKQEPSYVDFGSYNFDNQVPQQDGLAQSYPPLYGPMDPTPSPTIPHGFQLADYTVPRKLSLATEFLQQWNSFCASSPGSPSSPSGNYSASSPSEVHTPYESVYTPIPEAMDTSTLQYVDQGYGSFLPPQQQQGTEQEQYFPPQEFDSQVFNNLQEHFVYGKAELDMDYASYMQPPPPPTTAYASM